MIKSFVFVVAAFGLFAAAAQAGFAADGCGARWYPFYGYRQPSYLAQPTVYLAQPSEVVVQPGEPQSVTTNYWPSETTAAAPASRSVQRSTGGQWYPFYGYRRPAYLGQ